jgi:hypothetical protein
MGFDVEWVPVARPGWAPTKGRGGEVCLLQLAGRSVSVIIDLCAWFNPSISQSAALQVDTESTTGAHQEVWHNPEAEGQHMTHGQEGRVLRSDSEGSAQALCDAAGLGLKFERLTAEAALHDFLAATLFRDDVLKVPLVPVTFKLNRSPCDAEHLCVHCAKLVDA